MSNFHQYSYVPVPFRPDIMAIPYRPNKAGNSGREREWETERREKERERER